MSSILQSFLRSESIPLRLRKKIGKFVHIEKGIPFSIKFLGAEYNGRTGSLVDNKMYLYGRNEPPTLRLIQTLLEKRKEQEGSPAVFIDVGVNTGIHLVCGAVYADNVYGFEPWDKVRQVAQKNIDANAGHHIKIFPFGLSDKNEVLPFLRPAEKNMGMGAFVRGEAEIQKNIQKTLGVKIEDAISLEVRNGDEVMLENNIHPTVIKIDTEGFEKFVLDGLKKTLLLSRPSVIFEYSDITKGYFPDKNAILSAFPENYEIYGIKRSREFTKLCPYSNYKKFENLLAIPVEKISLVSDLM